MKPLFATIMIALLGLGTTACSQVSKPADSASKTNPDYPETVTTTAAGITYDNDDNPIRFYGHQAGVAEKQAITALVTRYYAAAAEDNGMKACSLIDSLITETIPEDYGQSSALHGKTCAVTMSKIFKQRHREHSPESATPKESATLKVIGVRVEGGIALVLLRFGKKPEPNHIAVHLEGHTWKIWELFGNHMP